MHVASIRTDVQFVAATVSVMKKVIQSWMCHPRNSIVLMIKPSVGLILVMSSFMMRFTIVVLPALSSPLWQP